MVNSVQEDFAALLSEERFGDIILIAWGYVEYVINRIFIEELALSSSNHNAKNVEFLTEELSFEQKWKFIKGLSIFEESEKEIITTFQHKRNKLFHLSIFNSMEYYDKKSDLIDIAKEAFYTASKVYLRKHKLPDKK